MTKEGIAQGMKGQIVFIDCENQAIGQKIETVVKKQAESSLPWSVLSYMPGDEVMTISKYFLLLMRKHGLHRNERQTVLSQEDQLITTQLCLANRNKELCGEFGVEASTVLEYKKKLVADKLGQMDLSLLPNSQLQEYSAFKSQYDEYLKTCNLIDQMDILSCIKEELPNNNILKENIEKSNFIIKNFSGGEVEQEMVKLLGSGKTVLSAKMAISLEVSINENDNMEDVPGEILTEDISLDDAMVHTNNLKPLSTNSVTEHYVEKVLLSYLQLMVNTRSELALAHVLNVPDRELDHKAFTNIKHETAGRTNMSMYQCIISYIMKIRLGGKGYAPDPSSALAQHVKGLSEFTDFVHKLQTVIEEDLNTTAAINRVLNIIKNTIIRSKSNLLHRQSIENVTEKLKSQAVIITNEIEKTIEESPSRSVGSGGSAVGRKTIKTIRTLLDNYASLPMDCSNMDLLTDAYSSQRTPVHIPCIMSKFRSPVECSQDEDEEKNLKQRVLEKQIKEEKSKQKMVVPRYQSCMDWVDPNVMSVSNEIGLTIKDYIPSKTIVQPGCAGPEKSLTRKVLESMWDQENDVSNDKPQNNMATTSSSSDQIGKELNKRKRDDNSSNMVSQPSKKAKKAQPKQSKKKVIPLQKGQKQLTAFFRM